MRGRVRYKSMHGLDRQVKGAAVSTTAECRHCARMPEAGFQSASQRFHRTKVRVVGVVFTRDQRVQRMVDVIIPLSVEAKATGSPRADQARIILIGLCNQGTRNTSLSCDSVCDNLHLLQNVECALVMQGMDRIQAQTVDVVVHQPLAYRIQNVRTHLIRVVAGEIDNLTPTRRTTSGVGPEKSHIVAVRTEVVIDHIKNDGQTLAVAGINQLL